MYLMLFAKHYAGGDQDDLENRALSYLLARGWDHPSAKRVAMDAAKNVIAEVNGVAGDVPS